MRAKRRDQQARGGDERHEGVLEEVLGQALPQDRVIGC